MLFTETDSQKSEQSLSVVPKNGQNLYASSEILSIKVRTFIFIS